MERCARCQISEDRVRLFDAIYEGRAAMLCERCSIIENIPLIKEPSIIEEKRYRDDEVSREKKLRELEKNPELELPLKKQLNLIDHFHWEIMKNRRRKGLSHKQLAEAIGESEIALEMLEKAKLPENSEILIRKIEQFFQISLRKINERDAMIMRKEKMVKTRPVLLDENGNELDYIPEPEVENIYFETREVKEIPWYKKILWRKKEKEEVPVATKIVEEELNLKEDFKKYEKSEVLKEEYPKSRYLDYRRREMIAEKMMREKKKTEEEKFQLKDDEDLDLDKIDITKVKIGDLKEIHKKRVNVTKQEKMEEQKMIKNEKYTYDESKKNIIDKILGGKELFKNKF